jgi:hypothetical protein
MRGSIVKRGARWSVVIPLGRDPATREAAPALADVQEGERGGRVPRPHHHPGQRRRLHAAHQGDDRGLPRRVTREVRGACGGAEDLDRLPGHRARGDGAPRVHPARPPHAGRDPRLLHRQARRRPQFDDGPRASPAAPGGPRTCEAVGHHRAQPGEAHEPAPAASRGAASLG